MEIVVFFVLVCGFAIVIIELREANSKLAHILSKLEERNKKT